MDEEKMKEREDASDGWTDLLDSGQLFRKIIKEGSADGVKPKHDERVIVRVSGKLNDETVVEQSDAMSFFVGHSDVVQALDLCVQMMTVGEIDMIKSSPRFAYGTVGRLPDIPPDSWIIYNVELLAIEPAPNYAMLSKETRIQLADAKRQRGNYFFQRGEYGSAIDVYQRTTKILSNDTEQSTEEDDAQLLHFAAAVYNNLAATQLKVDDYDAALDSLRCCIKVQPDNAKAWYRRGKAYSGKGDYENALNAFEYAIKLDPSSTAAKQEASRLKKILTKQEFDEKNLYRRMFAVDGSTTNRQSAKSLWNSIRQHGWWAFGATAATAVGLVVYHMLAVRNLH